MDLMEWKNEKEFAEAITDLLLYKGFKIDSYYDDIGPDGGRDIEAHTFEYDAALDELDSVGWWIELKYRSKSSLGSKDVADVLSKLARFKISKTDKFLIITNTQFTNTFKTDICSYCAENGIKIRFWDRTKLRIMFQKKEIDNKSNEYVNGMISDRLHETKLIFNTIQSGMKSVLLLVGTAGVGKSALARYIMMYMSKNSGYLTGIFDSRMQGGIGFQLKLLAEKFQNQNCITDFSLSSNIRMDEKERLELLINHCKKYKTLLVLDNTEHLQDINGEIKNQHIKMLVEKFLEEDMNGSVLLLLSRHTLNSIYNTQTFFFGYELKGWNIDFVYNKYLPYLQYLNTCIADISDEIQRKKILETMEGNPLALKIANQLCLSNDIKYVVNCIKHEKNPAQSLIKKISQELSEEEVLALNKFSQFERPMTLKEVRTYVCSENILNRLRLRMLIEPVQASETQYQMHPLTIAQFDLANFLDKRKPIVYDIVKIIFKNTENKNIEDIYYHGLLRQAVEMLINIQSIDEAAKIIIRIGTRALSMGDVDYLSDILERLKEDSKLSPLYSTRLKKVEGHIHNFNERYDLAKKIYQAMLSESLELKDDWSRAAALNGLGSIERYTNNCQRAISLYTESLQIRIDNNFEIDQSNSYHNLGAVYIILGDYDNAIKCLKKAISIRENSQDIFRMSATELYLGECYIHIGQFEESKKLLEQCIVNKEKVHDIVGGLWAGLAKSKLVICMFTYGVNEMLLKNETSRLLELSKLCQIISHTREYVISQIFLSVLTFFSDIESGNALEYAVNAKNKVNNTLLKEFYLSIIKKIINIIMSNQLTEENIQILKNFVLNIKI